jgi:DAK2 domain fusion protein YloV
MEQMDRRTAADSHAPAQSFAIPEGGSLEYPYDVQFILMGENLNVVEVRDRIDAMGDSTVVVGDETTIKVHIHVKDPGEPLTYGISLGRIDDVVVENMQMQMETIVGEHASIPSANIQPGQIGVITVAPGAGIADAFRSLHAAFIVDGGQTNNPSTENIFQAIQDVPTNNIIILPNNKNIVMAAEAARELSSKNVAVVASRTVPQGVMALMQLDLDGDLDEITAVMRAALNDVATGEITRAVRSVTLDGVDVQEGEFIGMVDGRLYASGRDMRDVIAQTLSGMDMDDREIVTIYYGSDASEADAQAVSQQIESLYEEVETEILPGRQPHYFYILGAE